MLIPVAVCVLTLGLFATRSLRADGIAVLALVCSVACGIVPIDRALSGLSNPLLVTIAAITVLAASVHRSGIIDLPRTALGRRLRLTTPVLLGGGILVALLAAVSGRASTRDAIPRVARLGEGSEITGLPLLLLNVACLLGGLLTAVGAVPNLLAAAVRRQRVGEPFALLDFLPVGAILLGAGLLLFAVAAVLTRRGAAARQAGPVDGLRRVKNFTSEVLLPASSAMAGRPIAELEAADEGAFHVLALVREGYRRIDARRDWVLEAGDLLILDCEPAVLHRLMERFGLEPADGPIGRLGTLAGAGMIEAVITQSSDLIGQSPERSLLDERVGIHLLGIGRNDDHPPGRLRRTRLRAGDIIVCVAETEGMPATLAALGCLLLVERRLRVGRHQRIIVPVAALLLALVVAGIGAAPLWLALLGGVVVLVLSRVLTLEEAYQAVPWPGLVMLASLFPLAATLHAGTASLGLAGMLAPSAAAAGAGMAVTMTMAATMVTTWVFGSAVAVLLLAQFAAAVATRAGLSEDMMLMAVAVGASIDMLAGRGLVAALIPGPGRRIGGNRWGLAIAAVLLVCGSVAVTLVWRS
ncbi:MAG: SLC13 family permease [Janthinobacterium lividum]